MIAARAALLALPRGAAPGQALSYTRFLADVGAGTVRAVTIDPAGHITGSLTSGQPFTTTIPVALGGMGNNRGAVIAGLLLGLFQQAANFLVGGIFASVAVFAVFILVLLARPDGLAGATQRRRV